MCKDKDWTELNDSLDQRFKETQADAALKIGQINHDLVVHKTHLAASVDHKLADIRKILDDNNRGATNMIGILKAELNAQMEHRLDALEAILTENKRDQSDLLGILNARINALTARVVSLEGDVGDLKAMVNDLAGCDDA